MVQKIVVILGVTLLSACSHLHHVQIGDIDNRQLEGYTVTPIAIKIDQLGFDIAETLGIASQISTNDHSSEQLEDLQTLVAMFHMGPSTGMPIYKEAYAEKLLERIDKSCPNGEVKNLISRRETNTQFATVAQETILVTGECFTLNAKT